MESFDRIFTKFTDRVALYICGPIIVIMTVYVCGNVFSRYVLKLGGIIGTYTYVGALLVPFIYLTLAYAWYKRGYIALDVLQGRLKGRVRWGFQFAFLIFTVAFVAVLSWGAFVDTIGSYATRSFVGEAGSYTPAWVWKATIVIGTFLMAVRNVLDMIRMVRTGQPISATR